MTQEALSLLEAARQGDRSAAEQMLKENNGLIWSVVRRYIGRGTESEDLYQLGCIGFLKAVEGFDTDYGTQFSTYAVPKIAGEIRRFLRDDGAIKVSRGTKERAMTIRLARDRLATRIGREPTVGELSIETGLEPEEIAAAETATATVTSLQMETGDGLTLESILGTDGIEEGIVEQVALREAISKLPQREQMVVVLRYFRGFTQDKVSQVLGVSQVQISRIEKKVMTRLRTFLDE